MIIDIIRRASSNGLFEIRFVLGGGKPPAVVAAERRADDGARAPGSEAPAEATPRRLVPGPIAPAAWRDAPAAHGRLRLPQLLPARAISRRGVASYKLELFESKL